MGYDANEAIQASTINTAELFGLNNIGEIKESFDADIVAVMGNPLDDITLLENIDFVMKEGQLSNKKKPAKGLFLKCRLSD